MKKISVEYSTDGKIINLSDNAVHYEQENLALCIEAKILTDKNVRGYIKAPNGNSGVVDVITNQEGLYTLVIEDTFMVKGTLYVGFEAYDDNGLAERFEPLKVYVDGFVSLNEDNADNVYVVTIDVAETVTLPADAESYVENVGTKKDVKLKFYIPRGERGEDGYTPIVGKDFYTEEEKSQFVEEVKKAFPIDGELSEISKNPVQNKVVANYLLNALVPLWSRATDYRPDRLIGENQIYVNQDGEVETIHMCEYVEEHGMVETAKEFKDKKAREQIGDIETALDKIIAIQTKLLGGDAK